MTLSLKKLSWDKERTSKVTPLIYSRLLSHHDTDLSEHEDIFPKLVMLEPTGTLTQPRYESHKNQIQLNCIHYHFKNQN